MKASWISPKARTGISSVIAGRASSRLFAAEHGRKEITVNSDDNDPPSDEVAGDVTVYYSTPFGDTKDGQQKVFMLARDGVPFYPVFYSRESMHAFFQWMNRAAYMIIEGNIQAVKDTMRSIEQLKNAGIVIEPFGEHPVEIRPEP